MLISSIVISPNLNTFYFSEAINNGLNVLNQADYQSQILQFQNRPNYFQKCTLTDPISLQFHTYFSGTSILQLCDRWQNVISGADATLAAAPIWKGRQVVAGNAYEYEGGSYGLTTTMWTFTFNDLLAYITPDTPTDWYYFKLTVYDKEFYSEPIIVRSDKFDKWGNNVAFPNTLLFNSTLVCNRAGNTNAVVSGWYNDYPTNTQPFIPNFYTRCEAALVPDSPDLIAIEYLMQNYDANFIYGQQYQKKVLSLGIASIGVPEYILQMITEFMLADKTSITMGIINVHGNSLYYQYKLFAPESTTSPKAIWKTDRKDTYPLIRATLPIVLGSMSQTAMIDPVPTPSAHVFNSVFNSVFA